MEGLRFFLCGRDRPSALVPVLSIAQQPARRRRERLGGRFIDLRNDEKSTFWVAVVGATAQVGRLLLDLVRWGTNT